MSYLGRELLTPLQVRQELLEERYEFTCRCPRCLAEGQLDPELQQLMHEIYSSVVQVRGSMDGLLPRNLDVKARTNVQHADSGPYLLSTKHEDLNDGLRLESYTF